MRLTEIDVERTRLWWWGAGLALGGALAFVLHSFVGTFVLGLFFYYAVRPVHVRLRRRIPGRTLAAATSLFAVWLPALAVVGYALVVSVQELGRLVEQVDLGQYEAMLGPYLDISAAVRDPASFLSDPSLAGTVRQALDAALDSLGFVGTGLLHLFVMLAVAFYLLRDGNRLARWFRDRFGDDHEVAVEFLVAVDRDFKNIFFGNLLNAFLTGAVGVIVYSVLGLFAPAGAGIPYPALVGALAGATSLVPIVGMKLVYVPVGLYLTGEAVLAGGPGALWFPLAFFVCSFVVVDVIPDLVLRPLVSRGELDLATVLALVPLVGRVVGAGVSETDPGTGERARYRGERPTLHVGMLMFAYILGPLLFGWYGLFLGPMLLVLVVHFAWLVLPELVGGEPIRPRAVRAPALTAPLAPSTAAVEGTAGPDGDGPERGGSQSEDDRRGDGDHDTEP